MGFLLSVPPPPSFWLWWLRNFTDSMKPFLIVFAVPNGHVKLHSLFFFVPISLYGATYKTDFKCLHVNLLLFSVLRRSSCQRKPACKAMPLTIKCEQNTREGNSLDVWLGRFAMVGFAAAISVEIATGKGLLEVWETMVFSFHLHTKEIEDYLLSITAMVLSINVIVQVEKLPYHTQNNWPKHIKFRSLNIKEVIV